uniref:Cadherin domain-containing protein n=1 Tax=Chelydra serpentina TaxID=8475 RepID=A0A8C3SRJ0_CHESE
LDLPGHYLQTNRKLYFSISEEEGDDHFEIDSSTGDLFLSKELDYETTSHFLLRVVMKDYNKNPPQNYTVFLSIDVEDQNDHCPYFQDNFIVIGIEENVPVGTLVYTFNAKDGDGSFLNSRVQYSIETSDSDQAINLTERRLGSLTNAEVSSLVHHVIAEDPDEGRNGQVTYHILSGNQNEAFLLDKTTGELLASHSLDREDANNFTLIIECHDLGSPPRSSTTQLQITVLDENDNSPIFAKNYYQTSVREDLEEGSVILELFASDEDDGLNGEVMYSLIDDTLGAFTVNSTTGAIVTTKALDRETKSQYAFRAVASDCSIQGPRSTTVNIMVHIDDVNDNSPVFPQNPFKVYVPPETSVNQTIATVRAADVDLGPNVHHGPKGSMMCCLRAIVGFLAPAHIQQSATHIRQDAPFSKRRKGCCTACSSLTLDNP